MKKFRYEVTIQLEKETTVFAENDDVMKEKIRAGMFWYQNDGIGKNREIKCWKGPFEMEEV